MIRKLFFLLLAAVILSPAFALGSYERAMRVTAREVVDTLNNFILVEDSYDQYLIHHKTGCGKVQEGDPLTLVIRGELDGIQDELYKGNYTSCIVDQAEVISGKLTVTGITDASTYISVSDRGTPYKIFYSERCRNIKNMIGQDVYVRRYGNTLRAGDKFFLPGAGEMCSINYLYREDTVLPPPEPAEGDHKRPTTPTHVRAIPSQTAVYLYWDDAHDNVGISHYVISASLYHRDDPVAQDPDVKPQEMPDTIVTPTNRSSMKLEGLESDELYFFRVIAVDTSGNESSYWSEEASAYTKSSIAQISLENSKLRLFQAQETDSYFLFRWTDMPGSRYTVALEVDGDRVFASSDWQKNYIRVLKKASRKGKDLELIVRSANFRGVYQSATAEFRF